MNNKKKWKIAWRTINPRSRYKVMGKFAAKMNAIGGVGYSQGRQAGRQQKVIHMEAKEKSEYRPRCGTMRNRGLQVE